LFVIGRQWLWSGLRTDLDGMLEAGGMREITLI
jgi:hypothetical protein